MLLSLIFLGLAIPLPCFATTRLLLDPVAGEIAIDVDDDAPAVIELHGDDLLPIRWDRKGLRKASLPAIAIRDREDLSIVDDSRVAYALARSQPLPRVRFDASRYASDQNWHGQPNLQRRTRLALLAVLFSLGLLLTLLVRRHALVLACIFCVAWSGGLLLAASRSPLLVMEYVHPELPLMRVYARERQTLRVPIHRSSGTWVPIVESIAHLRSLSMIVEVRGEDAELVADLPKSAKLFLTSRGYADALWGRARTTYPIFLFGRME